MIDFEEEADYSARIKAVGVGGAGCTVIDKIGDWGEDIELLAINTDVKALKTLRLHSKMRIGASLTGGLGAGGSAEIGRKAVEEDRERVKQMLAGSDLVFVVAGLGGGTGTGACPVIGEIMSELGGISVAVVTTPFTFEGLKRKDTADIGVQEVRRTCDTIVCIPNDKLANQVRSDYFLVDAFDEANTMLLEAVKAIYSLAKFPQLINLDFANIRELLRKSGDACFGVGTADGKNRAEIAAESALNSGLLQGADVSTGRSILVSISGSEELRREEVDRVTEILTGRIGNNLNMVVGVAVDSQLRRKLCVAVVVTHLKAPPEKEPELVSEENTSHLASGQKPSYTGHFDEDEWDIPTFLRKRREKRG